MGNPAGQILAQTRIEDAASLTKAVRQKLEEEAAENRKACERFYNSLALFSGGTIALSVTYLGRLSVRPRPYQFVPLIMALRLDPVRVLIADDVGIGKTIEAALIARELLDRGDIQRICVLCPPHLCDQWQRELELKFQIQARVVRTSTVARLERELPRQGLSPYRHYPHLVASIDFIKTERHKHDFLVDCPDLVIVDEAHAATQPGGRGSREQQQRHELVSAIADRPGQHLLLLTATPHSGIEEGFLSLLGMLDSRFERLNLEAITEGQRANLAKCFV